MNNLKLEIYAKCGDLFDCRVYNNNEFVKAYSGYPIDGLPITYSDNKALHFEIDVNTGQILNWDAVKASTAINNLISGNLEKSQEESPRQLTLLEKCNKLKREIFSYKEWYESLNLSVPNSKIVHQINYEADTEMSGFYKSLLVFKILCEHKMSFYLAKGKNAYTLFVLKKDFNTVKHLLKSKGVFNKNFGKE